MASAVPPGWPRELPPPGTAEFDRRVTGWLFDLCPPRYRDHDVLRRRPRALAWLAVRHVEAQVLALDEAVSAARAGLTEAVGARGVDEVLDALQAERSLLVGDARAVRLVAQALSGVRFLPQL